MVQVLVPSNHLLPNQLPVLITNNAQHITTPASSAPALGNPGEPAVSTATTTPEAVIVMEAKTISSYILDATTNKPTEHTSISPVTTPTTTTTTTTTTTPPPIVIIEETTDAEIPPEEIDAESEPVIQLEPGINEPASKPETVVVKVPNSSRMHYSADPPTDDEMLSNGILGVVPVPEVMMPPVAESSHRKLVMQSEDDPPEMLHDQEMPPAPTSSGGDEDV